MKQAIAYDNKYKIIFLFILSLIAIGIVLLGFDQSIGLALPYKKVINWMCWIALYFLAQFAVAIFIGKLIKGSNDLE
ncbi:MAG: hypothetical protein IAF02_18740 [Anaerolineae bacterium]|nr:hypothetical protein [Anaerolineae bacterium]